MKDPSPFPRARGAVSWRVVTSLAAVLLAAIAWIIWPSLRAIVGSRPSTSSAPVRLPDVYAGSPYKNARPDVAYVGDAACTRCHREIAVAYRGHPMGRSLAPLAAGDNGPPTNVAAGLPFEHKGVTYTIERRGEHVIHKATRRDADGALLAEIEAEVQFALGSGTRGISFLIDRNGYLFQSPIAWFEQRRRWDISPGYGEFTTSPNFERVIQPDCLFCHTNRIHAVAGTFNRYETPIFDGHAIGCERCHGPGELHVKRDLDTESDLTIVNPAHLTPALRDSVCEQCHLQGSFRFARAGRELFDYRPGLPIHEFLAVFLMKKGDKDKVEAVGHAEQMVASRCFEASKGELGCISCHDPHSVPAPSAKVAYYSERCLECHNKKGCALPLAQRQARGQGEDCIACHMPRPAIANIPHTATTDHRIPRDASSSAHQGLLDKSSQPDESPLVDFHWSLMTKDEQRHAERDMAVALGLAARNLRASPPFARIAATQGLKRLEAAVHDRPNDLTARELLGHTYAILSRPEDALRAFQEVLRVEPRRELVLRSAGRILNRLTRPELARDALQKTIAINPWISDYHLALAHACYQVGDWPAAVAACRDAIRLNPEFVEARSLLIQCYLRSHERDKADAEFQIMLRFYPASREVWEQWYEQQKQDAPGGDGSSATGKH